MQVYSILWQSNTKEKIIQKVSVDKHSIYDFAFYLQENDDLDTTTDIKESKKLSISEVTEPELAALVEEIATSYNPGVDSKRWIMEIRDDSNKVIWEQFIQ